MFSLSLIIAILVAHYIADFILQSDEMALNKSKDSGMLTYHVGVYTAAFTTLFGLFLDFNGVKLTTETVLYFSSLIFISHWVTDYWTSRLNAYLWGKNMRHWFFCVCGADQAAHAISILILVQYFIVGK